MSLYNSLLESVITEDVIVEALYDARSVDILNEGSMKNFIDRQVDRINGLTKLGLKREDLVEPAKIKRALGKIENLQDQQDKIVVKAVIVIIIAVITCIAASVIQVKYEDAYERDQIGNALSSMFGVSYKEEAPKYVAAMFGVLGISIGNLTFAAFGLNNDYQRLISAFNTQIKKIDKEVKKEEKKTVPDKGHLRDLKAAKDKLLKNRDLVINKYQIEVRKLNNVNVM